MPNWRILITDGLSENGQAILRLAARVEDRKNISADDLLQEVKTAHALIVRGRTRVNAAVFEVAVQLKVVGRAGVGVDNIDLQAAKRHAITVVNAPLSSSQAVAEHTLALILALARAIPRADAAMKSGQWNKQEYQGSELNGKVIGILGMGNIGSRVGRYAAALGMQPISFDPWLTEVQIHQRGAEPVALAELYARSDVISLHLPLTPETRGMIDGRVFSQMKRGVRLVCTARGGILDEAALLAALETGQVAGAALDVFAEEPPGLTTLIAHPNLIATPHIAAQTAEAQVRASEDIATEVLAALRGQPLRWMVG